VFFDDGHHSSPGLLPHMLEAHATAWSPDCLAGAAQLGYRVRPSGECGPSASTAKTAVPVEFWGGNLLSAKWRVELGGLTETSGDVAIVLKLSLAIAGGNVSFQSVIPEA